MKNKPMSSIIFKILKGQKTFVCTQKKYEMTYYHFYDIITRLILDSYLLSTVLKLTMN